MHPTSIREVTEVLNGYLHMTAHAETPSHHLGESTVTGVSISSRDTKPGDLFAAFVGERVDGHQFIEDAAAHGAVAALVTRTVDIPDAGIPLIQVADPLAAVQALAKFDRQRFNGPVIGVTGSNGKTTTKDMLAAALSGNGSCTATSKNLNNELGLPLTILRRHPDDWALVLEMGMRGKGQIAGLCEIAQPTVGIITNIGHSHIELLGSQEGIALAKAELIEALPASGAAVLHAEDAWLRKMAERTTANVYWYGDSPDSDARAANIRTTESGTHFDATICGASIPVFIQTYGKHNVNNALGALLIAALTSVDLSKAANGLAELAPASGRLRFVEGKQGLTVIDDCYNASPASMTASLEVLVDRAENHDTIAVIGDMYELGDFAEAGHRLVGAKAAELGVDRLVCIGDLGAWIADAAQQHGATSVMHFDTKEAAIAAASEWLLPHATVLVKASRGLGLEAVVAALTI